MDLALFQAYVDDFEQTIQDDQWQRLAQYFTHNAEYRLPDESVVVRGRDQILKILKQAVHNFDRLMDGHEYRTVEGPIVRNGEIFRDWSSRFSLRGAPDFVFEGQTMAVTDGDQIKLLQITATPESLAIFRSWIELHGYLLRDRRNHQKLNSTVRSRAA
jgi:hypothetical protein|tara:strand:+ start:4081 stop:4557 length:477 start_codon:yes stop_codon:yes gene_type:complete